MREHQVELKLAYSAVWAFSNAPYRAPLPKLGGSTNLYGKVRQLADGGELDDQGLVVITDGRDNSKEDTFIAGKNDDGSLRTVKVVRGDYEDDEAYMMARQVAILDYIAFVGGKVHLIGIGNEVKGIVKLAARRKMTVGHIKKGANASEVANVVQASIGTTRDDSIPHCVGYSSREEYESAVDARIITIDNLCGHVPLPAEQVAAIERDAASVVIGSEAFTVETFKKAVEMAEESCGIDDHQKKYTRGVLLWFMREGFLQKQKTSDTSMPVTSIPGALIGGKHGKIAEPPCTDASRLASQQALS